MGNVATISSVFCMPRENLGPLQNALAFIYSEFVVNAALMSDAQTESFCGGATTRRILVASSTTQEDMVGVTVHIPPSSDTDPSDFENLENHVCDTLMQQGLGISNCQESIVKPDRDIGNTDDNGRQESS